MGELGIDDEGGGVRVRVRVGVAALELSPLSLTHAHGFSPRNQGRAHAIVPWNLEHWIIAHPPFTSAWPRMNESVAAIFLFYFILTVKWFFFL